MRAVVLGATGHLGAHIVRALLDGGHQVRAAYRTERYLTVLEGLPVERVRVDLDTLDGLRESLEGCAWVFHAAGYYPGFRDRREPAVARGIAAARRVLEAIHLARPARVVFTSSAATIRRTPGRPAAEDDAEPWPPSAWRPLYATVKIAMEHEALRAARAGLPVVIVNPSLCLGEYDAHPFSGRAILAFAKYRLPVYVDHWLNAVYTGDVGIGHVRAAERGRPGERYLLTCRNLMLRELAGMAAACVGAPPPRWRIPYHAALGFAVLTEAAAWVTRTEPLVPRQAIHNTRMGQPFDGRKAVQSLGLPQTSVEEAVRRAVAWFRLAGYL